MSRKQKHFYLLEKSVQAVISAIEIYNKPDFKYREESFSILMVNAWETLLKSKIVLDNSNDLRSIRSIDYGARKKDGQPFKNPQYKKNRSGNYLTIDIFNCIKLLSLPERLSENIELIVEIRDNAIHFYNESKLFEKKVLEIGTATLKSYMQCANEWFEYDLSKYNFYLMPISFFHTYEIESFSINNENAQHQNLLNYIARKENDFPSNLRQDHNISLVLETKFVRSKSIESLKVKYDNDDPIAITVKVSAEEEFAGKYQWSFRDDLVPKLKTRYSNIKFGDSFRKLMHQIESNPKLCGIRYLDFKNKKGSKRKFYSPNVLKTFDKHYKKNNE